MNLNGLKDTTLLRNINFIENAMSAIDDSPTATKEVEPAPKPRNIAERRRQLHKDLMGVTKTSPMKKVRTAVATTKRRALGSIASIHCAHSSFVLSKKDALVMHALGMAYNNILPIMTDATRKRELDEAIITELNKRLELLYVAYEQVRREFAMLYAERQTYIKDADDIRDRITHAERTIVARACEIAETPHTALKQTSMLPQFHKTGDAPFRNGDRGKKRV